MSREPQKPQTPVDVKDGASVQRRKYAPPRLKRLGSVRDLTLGSPPGKAADGAAARRDPNAM